MIRDSIRVTEDSSGTVVTTYIQDTINALDFVNSHLDFLFSETQKIWDVLYCNENHFFKDGFPRREDTDYYKAERECWIEFREKFIKPARLNN